MSAQLVKKIFWRQHKRICPKMGVIVCLPVVPLLSTDHTNVYSQYICSLRYGVSHCLEANVQWNNRPAVNGKSILVAVSWLGNALYFKDNPGAFLGHIHKTEKTYL